MLLKMGLNSLPKCYEISIPSHKRSFFQYAQTHFPDSYSSAVTLSSLIALSHTPNYRCVLMHVFLYGWMEGKRYFKFWVCTLIVK